MQKSFEHAVYALTEEQRLLLTRIEKLFQCVNDNRLSPQERGAAYHTMEQRRIQLEELGVSTTIDYFQIFVSRILV